MKLKKVMALALAAVMTVSLAACGGGGNDGGSGSSKGNDSSTSSDAGDTNAGSDDSSADSSSDTGTSSGDALSVMIWDNNQQPGIQEILNDFTEKTGIKAETQVVTWNEYWTLLEAGAQGGTLPDVFWMHSNEAQRYMENDMLLDLTDKIKESEVIDLANYPEDITGIYTSDGKNYAIPKDVDTIGLWYNKTMFDEAGISYPDESWTWDDFREAAKKLTKEDGSQFGYAIKPDANQDSYYNMIFDYGGFIISDDKKSSGYDDPNTIKGMQMLEGIFQDGSVPSLETVSENGPDVLLQSGKIAMSTQGSWMVAAFRDNEYTAKNCDVAVLPKGPDGTRKSIYNGLGWAAAANGKNTENAWKLLEYLGSKEAQEKQAQLGVTMSAYKDTSDAWANSVEQFNLQAYLDMMEDMVIRPYSRTTITWENMANEKFKAAWTGEKSMEEVCKEIAAEMNATLAEE